MDAAIVRIQLTVNSEQLSVKNKENSEKRKLLTDNCSLLTDNCSLTFAGAKLPLVYIQNNDICIIKGDRQSIGYKRSRRTDINFDFTNHVIHIKKGIAFYLFSDGFADQLGGKEEHRFGNKNFYRLLKENAHLPFEKQQEIIIQRFNEYKGDYDNMDDVTVMGFRF